MQRVNLWTVWAIGFACTFTIQARLPICSAAEDEVKKEASASAGGEVESEDETAGDLLGYALRGEFSTGIEWFTGDHASSKFNEYRDLPSGGYLKDLFLAGESKNQKRFFKVRANDVREEDQSVELRFGRYGGHQLKLELDRAPHVFSNTGRLFFRSTTPGVFTVADSVQTTLNTIETTDTNLVTAGTQIDTAAFGSVVNGIVAPVDLSLQRRKTTLTWSGVGNSSPDLTYKVSYADEERTGARPIGSTLSSFTNQNELPEPIDYRTRDLKGTVEYGSKRGFVTVDAVHSKFTNHVKSLTWDNPIQLADSTTEPATGRMGLPPDNTASEVSLSGAWHLSDIATLTGALSRGSWKQNDAFLPFTTNTVLVGVPALPATSLNGKIKTSLTNFGLNVAPRPDLTLRAFYREYENNNQTPQLDFAGYVRTDATVALGAIENEPVGYKQGNEGLEAVFSATPDLSLKLTLDRETWDREHRDVHKTRDNRLGLSADYRFNSWLTARGSVRQANRRIEGAYVAEDPSQLGDLRKFDESDRDRNEASLILQATPGEKWDSTLTLLRARNKYPNSPYGVSEQRSSSFSAEVGYALSSRIRLYAGYVPEQYMTNMKSRYRPVVGGVTVDDPVNDWSSNITDQTRTYWLGLNSVLIPDKLDLDFGLSYSVSKGRVGSSGVPGSNPVTVPPAVDPTDPLAFPDTRNSWFEPSVELRYHLNSDLTAALGFRIERYRETDFAQDPMQPYMQTADSTNGSLNTWLGATQPGYTARIFTLELRRSF